MIKMVYSQNSIPPNISAGSVGKVLYWYGSLTSLYMYDLWFSPLGVNKVEVIFEVTQVKGKSVDHYIINQAIINEWGLTLLFSVILSLF